MRTKLYLGVTICFITFLLVPVFLVGNSVPSYHFLNLNTFLFSLSFYTAVSSLIASVVIVVISLTPLRKLLPFFLYFALSWIILSGFIFPIAASTEMVSPHKNPTDWLHFCLVVTLSAIGGLLGHLSTTKPLIIFSTCVCLSAIPAMFKIFDAFAVDLQERQATHRGYELSDKHNILVFSFDSLSGKHMSELVKQSPELSNTYKDFTIFENALTPGLTTKPSLAGDLYGNIDYRGHERDPSSFPYDEKLKSNLRFLLNEDTYFYGYPLSHPNIKKLDVINNLDELYKAKKTTKVLEYSIVRMFGVLGHRVLHHFYRVVPKKNINDLLVKVSLDGALRKQLIDHYAGPDWAAFHVVAKTIFDTVLSELHVKDKKLAVRYFHFLHTHHPVAFDENCGYQGHDKAWLEKHQNPAGAKLLYFCGLDSFSKVLQRLKQINVYDNSLIILKSDHGLPSLYYDEFPFNTSINWKPKPNEYAYGFGRYNAALFVKDFKANQSAPNFSNRQVLTSDIGYTICKKIRAMGNCDSIKGKNLFNTQKVKDQPFYLEIPINKNLTKWEKIPSLEKPFIESLQSLKTIQIHEAAQ